MLVSYYLSFLLTTALCAPTQQSPAAHDTSINLRSESTPLRPASVKKTIVKAGTGAAVKSGDTITVHYTGWLYDTSKAENKGKEYESAYDVSNTFSPRANR